MKAFTMYFFFFFRDVDGHIVNLLRRRTEDCVAYEGFENEARCKKVFADYDEAALNWFIKC